MTLAEFKAWFEGFTEDMDGPPDAKQWKRIKSKIKDINGVSVSPVVIREYYDRYRRWWPDGVWYGGYPIGAIGACELPKNGGMSFSSAGSAVVDNTVPIHELGRAEYKSMLTT